MGLLPVRATQHAARPGAEVEGTKHDACRVASRHRDTRLFAPESPGTTHNRKEAQHRFILTEQHGVGWELPQPADYRPFFCARCGAFSS